VPGTRRLLALAAAGGLVLLGTSWSSATAAVADKQNICHATGSDTVPYIHEAPAKSGDLAGHVTHTGPLWSPTLKGSGIAWGDIVPPFDWTDATGTHHFAGLNWPAGQATFDHGCTLVAPAAGLSVVKTNDADRNGSFTDDETAAAAGSDVAFRVAVTNTGSVPVEIDSVVDLVGGTPVVLDCSALVGSTVAVGATVTCNATATAYSPAAGQQTTNQVTVDGHQGAACAGGACTVVEDPANTTSAADTSVVRTAAGSNVPVTPTIDPTLDPTVDPTTDPGTDPTATPTTDPTTKPTVGPATKPTGHTGGGGTIEMPHGTEGPFTGGGGTVTLPFTGVPTALLLGTAAGLLALGIWLTVLGRRPNGGPSV
jgi:hypothetical protein